MTEIINDTLGFIDNQRKKIKPEYTRGGKPVYTLRNYASLTDLDAEIILNGGYMNPTENLPTIGRDGNLLRTPRTSYAVNVDIAFDNRVKVIENKDKSKNKYIFVIDQRALMQQKTGELYTNKVVGFVIGKNAKGEPEVLEVVHIDESEFLNDYDTIFDTNNMVGIMEVINKYRVEHGTAKTISEL